MPRLQRSGRLAGGHSEEGGHSHTRLPRSEVIDLLATAVLELLINRRIPAGRLRTPAPRKKPAAAPGGPP